MPLKLELSPLAAKPHSTWQSADRAYAEAGRTLFGLAGVSIVIFPHDDPTDIAPDLTGAAPEPPEG